MQENYHAIKQDINLENTDFFTLTSLYTLIVHQSQSNIIHLLDGT